jgi:ABC-type multidrug transport system fused ATPase/permease subunit
MSHTGLSNLRPNIMSSGTRFPFRLLRELIWAPVFSNRKTTISTIFALCLLSSCQNIFILLTGLVMPALLGMSSGESSINALKILPKSLRAFVPNLESLTFSTESFAVWAPVMIVISGLGIGLGSYLYQVNQGVLSLLVAKEYRRKLFSAILSLKFSDIAQRSASEWMSVVMNDVQFLQTRISDILNSLVRDGVKVLSALILLFIIHWPTALFVLLGSPVLAFGMGRVGKKIARYSEEFQRDLGKMASFILDTRKRFPFVRAQQGELFELARFDRINSNYYGKVRNSILIRSAFAPGLEFIGFAFFSLTILLVNHGWFQGSLNPATFSVFLLAVAAMVKPLGSIGEQVGKFHESMGVLRESLIILERVRSAAVAFPVLASEAGQEGLKIEELTISYGESMAFQARNLRVESGACVAVVGPSGSGKSSLLKCLSGLVEPTSWVGMTSWSQVVATSNLVSQTPFLFTATIRENLLYGLEGRLQSEDDEEIWKVIEFVGLSTFLKFLPKGLDAEVSAISANLSGGQTQRLVIARALLRDRSLILLDEATSAVDIKNEREIVLRTIDFVRKRRGMLIAVTHRLQWLAEYDQVWFVEHGVVIASGRHSDLLQQTRYAEFIGQQDQES